MTITSLQTPVLTADFGRTDQNTGPYLDYNEFDVPTPKGAPFFDLREDSTSPAAGFAVVPTANLQAVTFNGETETSLALYSPAVLDQAAMDMLQGLESVKITATLSEATKIARSQNGQAYEEYVGMRSGGNLHDIQGWNRTEMAPNSEEQAAPAVTKTQSLSAFTM